MLSPADISTKALRRWPEVCQAACDGRERFPMAIPLGPPSSEAMLEDFTGVAAWVRSLRALADANGFELTWSTLR